MRHVGGASHVHRWHPGGCGLCVCAFPGVLMFVCAAVASLAVRVKRMLRGSALKLWAGTLLPRLLFPRALRGCTVCGDRNRGVHPLHHYQRSPCSRRTQVITVGRQGRQLEAHRLRSCDDVFAVLGRHQSLSCVRYRRARLSNCRQFRPSPSSVR